MNLILILLSVAVSWRPGAAPVTPADLVRVSELERAPEKRGRTGPAEYHVEDVIAGKVVVGFVRGAGNAAEELVRAAGGSVAGRSLTGGDFLTAEFPGRDYSATIELARNGLSGPAIRFVEPLLICRALYEPNDPFYSEYQWGDWVMYSDKAWDLTLGSRNTKVAIIDEGIDYLHPDLTASFDPGLRGYDFVDNDPDPYPGSSIAIHGTHVAGIVAATINNGIGVAGWAQVTLYSCRALNDSGSGPITTIADAIRWAADHDARVINLSLGSNSPASVLQDAVDYAWGRGSLVVAASGNDGVRGVYFPASYAHALAIGALDTTGFIAGFSNYGPELDLTAPGVGIASTVPGNQYMFMDGTSMATPEATGVIALLLSYKPSLTNGTARAIIEAATVDMGVPGKDEYYGYGLVNAWRALQLAQSFGGTGEPVFALGRQKSLTSVVEAGVQIDLPGFPGSAHIRVADSNGRLVGEVAEPGHGFCLSRPGVYFVFGDAPGSHDCRKLTVVR